MEYVKRPKPTWIPTRVPVHINCQSCGGLHTAKFTVSPAELTYTYSCGVCGAVASRSLEELNNTAPLNN